MALSQFSSGSMGKACSVAAAHIAESVRDMGLCPDDLSPAIAAAEIHVHADYRGTPCTAVPLNEERIALPAQGAHPVCLTELLGPAGRDEVERFISQHILPHSEGVQVLADSGIHAYMDPGLRCAGRRYHRFICRLFDAGMLDFTDTDVACEIGLFAVNKKGDKQRLVLDVVQPPSISMPRLIPCFYEAPDCGTPFAAHHARGTTLYSAQFDLNNAFSQIGLPKFLRRSVAFPVCVLQLSGFSTSEGGALDQNNSLHHACLLCYRVGTRPTCLSTLAH